MTGKVNIRGCVTMQTTAGKADKYSAGYDRTLDCILVGYIVVQVMTKMKRFRRVMAVQGKYGQCMADRAGSNMAEQ